MSDHESDGSERESAGEQSKSTMRGVITLSSIPPLRYLYKNKTLTKAAKQRFSAKEDLLDRIHLFQGDITRLQIDSIVNAANRSLL
ncbi:14918_t:CDS:2, partial [Acaulospora colombiana]